MAVSFTFADIIGFLYYRLLGGQSLVSSHRWQPALYVERLDIFVGRVKQHGI